MILMAWTIYSMIHTLPGIREKIVKDYQNETYQGDSYTSLSGRDLRVLYQVLDFVFFAYFLAEYLFR